MIAPPYTPTPLPMVRLFALGTVDLRTVDGDEAVRSILNRPKRMALLAYLALARPPGPRRRDTVLGVFWPDRDTDRARRALNQALYVLRKGVGEGVLVTEGTEDVALDRSRFWCDAWDLQEALGADRPEEALELYRGELLAGFHAGGPAEFDRWLDAERRHCARAVVAAARGLGTRRLEAGDATGAIHALRRATRIAPFDEIVRRELMTALAKAGDRAGAIREYERLERALDETVQDLIDDIRTRPDQVDDHERLAARLKEAESITPRVLITVLRRGQIRLFQILFGTLSGLDLAAVRNMMTEPGGETLALTCRALGVEKANFASIFLLSRAARPGEQIVDPRELSRVLALFDRLTLSAAVAVLDGWRQDPEYLMSLPHRRRQKT